MHVIDGEFFSFKQDSAQALQSLWNNKLLSCNFAKYSRILFFHPQTQQQICSNVISE